MGNDPLRKAFARTSSLLFNVVILDPWGKKIIQEIENLPEEILASCSSFYEKRKIYTLYVSKNHFECIFKYISPKTLGFTYFIDRPIFSAINILIYLKIMLYLLFYNIFIVPFPFFPPYTSIYPFDHIL